MGKQAVLAWAGGLHSTARMRQFALKVLCSACVAHRVPVSQDAQHSCWWQAARLRRLGCMAAQRSQGQRFGAQRRAGWAQILVVLQAFAPAGKLPGGRRALVLACRAAVAPQGVQQSH